jgi:hypothetical protein
VFCSITFSANDGKRTPSMGKKCYKGMQTTGSLVGTISVFNAKQLFHISITKLTFVNYDGNLYIHLLL